MAPLKSIRELHRRAARELGIGPREDIESLLSEVQQLLVGISIMQVSTHPYSVLMSISNRVPLMGRSQSQVVYLKEIKSNSPPLNL